MFNVKTALATLAVTSVVSVAAQAVPVTYFGEDLGLGEGTALGATPNADAAQASFLSGLINPGVETFEGIAGGTGTPLGISFANGVTANLTGTGNVTALAEGVTNGAGRYGVTGDGGQEHYWEVDGAGFTMTFSQPVSAFGFYGIDIGDFSGQVTVTTVGGLNQVFNVGNTINGAGGGVLFWGVIDAAATFASVTFGNTNAGTDIFAFDDFTIGTIEQVRPTPVPASVALVGLGLLLMRRFARR
ncbi:MAG: hypothetical protein Hals2KO_29730 [Halioglobus sp.]